MWPHLPRPLIRSVRSVVSSEPCRHSPCPTWPTHCVLCRFSRIITTLIVAYAPSSPVSAESVLLSVSLHFFCRSRHKEISTAYDQEQNNYSFYQLNEFVIFMAQFTFICLCEREMFDLMTHIKGSKTK